MKRALKFIVDQMPILLLSLFVYASVAGAQTIYWRLKDGTPVTQTVMLTCENETPGRAEPCGGWARPLRALMMPFVRGTNDPIILSGITTTPKQFMVTKPPNSTAYRMVNPCQVDIRIRKVDTMQQVVTPTTGTLYLSRTTEVMGSSSPAFISVMAMTQPDSGTPCNVEMLYGDGS